MGVVHAVDEDDDRNGDVTYTIQSVFGRNRFALDRRSGVLTVNDALDFEKVCLDLPEVMVIECVWFDDMFFL